ncbi:MAG: hypothetical protein U1E76_25015 [Planctomycetota bacterium]
MQLLQRRVQYLYVFGYYIYLLIPYFFAGLCIAMALKAEAEQAPRMYGANLVGSAAGCFLFIVLLKPLGGAGSLFLVAATSALAAACFAWQGGARKLALVSSAAALALLVACLPLGSGASASLADRCLVIEPAPSKAMMQQGLASELTVWDPLCRLDVTNVPRHDKFVYQDGDAPTALPNGKGHIDLTSIYGLAYHIKPRPDVLVIGIGGGQDLWIGRMNKAKSVTGAEINPSTVALMRGPYRDYNEGIYDLPAEGDCGPVHVEVAEGRAFVRRTHSTYDLIQMTGTDTYTALASGSYVMSESYLYTVEAFQDYFAHLNPDGVVCILRFGFRPPRESLRMCTIAAEAMRARGVAQPSRRVIVVNFKRQVNVAGQPRAVDYCAMIFKNGEFTDADIATIDRYVAVKGPEYSIAYSPGRPSSEPEYREYFAAADKGSAAVAQFLASYKFDVTPTHDDSPFFFQNYRWSSVLESVKNPDWFGMIGEDPVGLYILVTVLLEASVLILVLVFLPLLAFRRGGVATPGKLAVGTYFFGIGMAYLMLEVAAMQKFALYLGHPVYSLTVVLATFLVFSGIGSFVAGRLRAPVRIAIPAIVVLCLGYLVLLPLVFSATLGLGIAARVAISIALLGVLAFFMGMPFPAAIRSVDRSVPQFVPWVWGVNGSASVLASIVAVFLAMAFGFSTVFALAAGFYLLALVCSVPLFRLPALQRGDAA